MNVWDTHCMAQCDNTKENEQALHFYLLQVTLFNWIKLHLSRLLKKSQQTIQYSLNS